jgi:hypothetical protein
MRRVIRRPVHTVLLSYAIVLGSGKQTLQSMQDTLAQQGKSCPTKYPAFDEFYLGNRSFHGSIVDPPYFRMRCELADASTSACLSVARCP